MLLATTDFIIDKWMDTYDADDDDHDSVVRILSFYTLRTVHSVGT